MQSDWKRCVEWQPALSFLPLAVLQIEPAVPFECNVTWPGNATHLSIHPYIYENYQVRCTCSTSQCHSKWVWHLTRVSVPRPCAGW